jgi:asparagine synthase (glutamine-hydrolysing)
MCGIWALLATDGDKISETDAAELKPFFDRIQYRGPDDSKWLIVDKNRNLLWGFHRLAINGLGHSNDEPLRLDNLVLICNGEIYNYPKLQATHQFTLNTANDCEIILHMYRLYGADRFVEMVHQLDGVFSFQLYDGDTDSLYVANDPFGIRPLYWTVLDGPRVNDVFVADGQFHPITLSTVAWASEPKALTFVGQPVDFFPPGHVCVVKNLNRVPDSARKVPAPAPELKLERYYNYRWTVNFWLDPVDIPKMYLGALTRAVNKRLLSDRPIGCLLSGGLDSSMVTALVVQESAKRNGGAGKHKLQTFSIGLAGAPDLYYAQIVADYLGTQHHSVVVTEEEFLAAIPDVIKAIQSYDITTVRASCGNWLLGRYIKKNTDCIVIFNGDVSEEINASYLYSAAAPNPHAFHTDNIRLMREVHRYDIVRCARSMENNSLEPRTPFSDRFVVEFVMSIDPKLKMFGKSTGSMEKELLRQAGKGLLPDEILNRRKTAFSDGVSEKTRSWYQIIGEHVDKLISDEEFANNRHKWDGEQQCSPSPPTKEAYYYRKLFEEILPNQGHLVKEYWMPRFVAGATDPSARTLAIHSE